MRFAASTTLALAFGAVGLAAAQTTTGSGFSICAQNIVDACVEGYQPRIKACQGNDWVCLCDVYTDVNQCYDNCPQSNERPPVQNQVTQFCAAAAPLKSSSLAAAATAVKSSVSSATGSSQSGSQSATGTEASATPFNTNAAAPVSIPMGGAFAVLLGVAGLL